MALRSKKFLVLWNVIPLEEGELSLAKGEVIAGQESRDAGWWIGERVTGQVGLFPRCYCKEIGSETSLSLPDSITLLPCDLNRPNAKIPYSKEKLEECSERWYQMDSDLHHRQTFIFRDKDGDGAVGERTEPTEKTRKLRELFKSETKMPRLRKPGVLAEDSEKKEKEKDKDKKEKAKKKGKKLTKGSSTFFSPTISPLISPNPFERASSSSSKTSVSSSVLISPRYQTPEPLSLPHPSQDISIPSPKIPASSSWGTAEGGPLPSSSENSSPLPTSQQASSSLPASHEACSSPIHFSPSRSIPSPSLSPSHSRASPSPSRSCPSPSPPHISFSLPSISPIPQRPAREKKTNKSPLQKRTHILKELLSTEETYVKGLLYLQHGFVECLQSAGLISPEMLGCQKLFGSLRSLSGVHNNLLRDLRARYSTYDEATTKVGDLLSQMLPYFKLYVEYVNYYGQCLEEVRSLTQNKKSNAVISKLRVNDEYEGFFGFGSLLISPIQRIPRYELLLRDLHQNTEENHCDYADLAKAAEGTRAISTYINEQKRKIETDQRIGQISTGLRGARSMMRESVYSPSGAMDTLKVKTKPHSWKPKNWKEPIWCYLCNKPCVENEKFKGMQCRNCSWQVHRGCASNCPKSCGLVGGETLLKHDRKLLEEITGIEYCQLLTVSGNEGTTETTSQNCSLFIFNDSFVCLELVGDSEGEYNLLCMIKLFSRSSGRFAMLCRTSSQNPSLTVAPAREAQLFHRFIFKDLQQKERVEKVLVGVMENFKEVHEENEQRRNQPRVRARTIAAGQGRK